VVVKHTVPSTREDSESLKSSRQFRRQNRRETQQQNTLMRRIRRGLPFRVKRDSLTTGKSPPHTTGRQVASPPPTLPFPSLPFPRSA
jgi:hypothetical protein